MSLPKEKRTCYQRLKPLACSSMLLMSKSLWKLMSFYDSASVDWFISFPFQENMDIISFRTQKSINVWKVSVLVQVREQLAGLCSLLLSLVMA